MQQIKFRAWDKEKEVFYQSDDGHGFEFCLSPMAGNYVSTLNGETLLDSDIPWQQFTGLLDKNGKEIYEGDIITWYDSGVERNVEVKWEYASWVVDTTKMSLFHYCEYIGEVIGNIYENPELLK